MTAGSPPACRIQLLSVNAGKNGKSPPTVEAILPPKPEEVKGLVRVHWIKDFVIKLFGAIRTFPKEPHMIVNAYIPSAL